LKYLVHCLVAVIAPLTLSAQDRPKFEVASIKECKPGDSHPPSTNSPGRLSLSCWPLKRLIQDAYEVFAAGKVDPQNPFFPAAPIEGTPDWVNSASYSIDARSDSPQTPAAMRGPMMQALLEDRFQMRTHRETREVPVYIMTVAKGGPKLTPTKEDSCLHLDTSDLNQPEPPRGAKLCVFPLGVKRGAIEGVAVYGITLDVYAKLLHAERPVIDRTRLTGAFDITLEYPPDPPRPSTPDSGAASDPGTSLFSSLREQLGLQLTPGKGPHEFLIVDRIERPSAN